MKVSLKTISVDNGGSELRVKPLISETRKTNINNNATGSHSSFVTRSVKEFSEVGADNDYELAVIKCPGAFCRLNPDKFRTKEVQNKFHVINILNAPKQEYIGYFAVGKTAKMFDNTAIEFTSQEMKSTSVAFYQRFLFGVALGLVSDEIFQDIETDRPYNDIMMRKLATNYEMVIATNIPIKEYASDADLSTKVKDSLAGNYAVEFPLLPNKPVLNFVINKKYIGILPEGGVVLSTMKKQLDDDAYSLLIDLGHVSGDYAIYLGTTLIGSFVLSSKQAGSTLLTKVQSALIDNGHFVNSEMAFNALRTGTVQKGTTSEDVSEIITDVKRKFVLNNMKADLIGVFNGTGIAPDQISNIIPIGASFASDAANDVIPLTIKEVLGMKNVEIKLPSQSPRYANITAVSVFAEILERAALKALQG